jgi:hypothetical protein
MIGPLFMKRQLRSRERLVSPHEVGASITARQVSDRLWHYDGRTSKHGAFMGGADFVQWHGNYPMLQKTVELKTMAVELRREHGRAK